MMDSMYMVLPPDIESLEELEYWYNKFMQMTYYQRKTSNDISISQFGEDNITRYNKMKSDFYNKYAEDYDNQYKYISNLLSYVESTIDSEVWADNYEERMRRVNDAQSQGLIIMVPDSYENIDDLKSKWDRFNSLSQEQRSLSDQTAMSIFGIDNYNLYNKFLNQHLENIQKCNAPTSQMNPDLCAQVDTYYTSEEMGNSKSSSTIVSESGKILDKYRWVNELQNLTVQLKYIEDSNKIKSIKEQIYNLWWNPEIPFSLESANKTHIRKKLMRLSESTMDNDIYTMAKYMI